MKLHSMELHLTNYCFSARINISNTRLVLFLGANENE